MSHIVCSFLIFLGVLLILSCSQYLSSATGYSCPIKTVKLEAEGKKVLRKLPKIYGKILYNSLIRFVTSNSRIASFFGLHPLSSIVETREHNNTYSVVSLING
jgi:hypothetical protein